MDNAHNRKKQPQLVRRALLDCAAKLALEQGLSAVTIQAVADAAGVTKGGLFHHFESKQALVEGMFEDLLARLDGEIDRHMAGDGVAEGRFTRAYVNAVFSEGELGFDGAWSRLSIAMSAEPDSRALWGRWISGRLERHRETDHAPMLEIVRLAADGAWLSYVGESGVAQEALRALHQRLIDLATE